MGAKRGPRREEDEEEGKSEDGRYHGNQMSRFVKNKLASLALGETFRSEDQIMEQVA